MEYTSWLFPRKKRNVSINSLFTLEGLKVKGSCLEYVLCRSFLCSAIYYGASNSKCLPQDKGKEKINAKVRDVEEDEEEDKIYRLTLAGLNMLGRLLRRKGKQLRRNQVV